MNANNLHNSNLMSKVTSLSVLERAYVRYMDDFIIFTKSRFQLRRMLSSLYKVLTDLKLSLAYDKTYIGKISNGSEFLGFAKYPGGISLSKNTLCRMFQKLVWLYEHQAPKERLRIYLTRWQTWVKSQVGNLSFPININIDPNPLKPIRISLKLTAKGYVLSV